MSSAKNDATEPRNSGTRCVPGVEISEPARRVRHLVVRAQIDDATDAEGSERGDAAIVELGEIPGAVEHARAGVRRAGGQAADIAEVDGAAYDGISGACSPGRARRGVPILSGQIVTRRDAGSGPAIATRLNALIETRIQLSADVLLSR